MAFPIYTDENIPLDLVERLRSSGVNVVRCQEIAPLGETDYNHLETALQAGRVLVTRDFDFVRLCHEWVNSNREHAGVIYVQPAHRDNISLIVRQVMTWHERFDAKQMKNAVWWV